MAVASSMGKKLASPEPEEAEGGGGAGPAADGPDMAPMGERDDRDPLDWGDQELGAVRRRTPRFRGMRKGKTDTSDLRQNQLLLRLDKLLYDGPNENGLAAKAALKARRDYERTVVTWTDDSMVTLCPDCHKPFGMLRRKHHCRLCGTIICADCSLGLELDVCLKMLADSGVAIAAVKGDKEDRRVKVTSDHTFRACETCVQICQKTMVSHQVQKEAEAKMKKRHVLVKMHDLLVKEHRDLEERLPTFTKVAFSLLRGEQLERYDWAEMERQTITRKFNALNEASQKIKVFNTGGTPSNDAVRVQANIRRRFQEFLQQHQLTLVKLPERREVEKTLREREVQAEAKRQKEAAARTAADAERHSVNACGDGGSAQQPLKDGSGSRTGDEGRPRPQNGGTPRDVLSDRGYATSYGTGTRRGYGGFAEEQPSWRRTWHDVSRPKVQPMAGPADLLGAAGRRMSYVDRHAPDIQISSDEVKSETRVKMRRMLKQAQQAGAIDEVEMLQMQIAELDRMS